MQEDFHDIIAAVITGNATAAQQQAFEQLMAGNDAFRTLYRQLSLLYRQPENTATPFDTGAALARLKQRLGQ